MGTGYKALLRTLDVFSGQEAIGDFSGTVSKSIHSFNKYVFNEQPLRARHFSRPLDFHSDQRRQGPLSPGADFIVRETDGQASNTYRRPEGDKSYGEKEGEEWAWGARGGGWFPPRHRVREGLSDGGRRQLKATREDCVSPGISFPCPQTYQAR